MKPVRTPQDGAQMVKDYLKARAATAHPELSVRLELPDWKFGDDPVLVIADDGGAMSMWPVATSPIIRVTSWTTGRERKYIHWALGQLLAAKIPGIAAILPSTGVLDARDSATRGDLASFTVRTRIRTI